ncbi:hypothetical protein [Nocardioides campestrisoli]|uniref:hypothetical protein n=1 Tax=Nocardioides campestrisoli TaxID=2736757 RepID=UPI0015E65A48|nr:hypothetical protein [Nocardioides campestrisoli]
MTARDPLAEVLAEHADCRMNAGDTPGAGLTGVDVWSCGIAVPFVDELEDAERAHLAAAVRAFLASDETAQPTLCRTCMRPITHETRTEPGFLPREGWYDDARTDALVCFKAIDYRHVPLTDRERAYYDAGRRAALSAATEARP